MMRLIDTFRISIDAVQIIHLQQHKLISFSISWRERRAVIVTREENIDEIALFEKAWFNNSAFQQLANDRKN